jgi:hypothetical protein
MNEHQPIPLADDDLWYRLESFKFDNPLAEYSFSNRLAKENRWSHYYALKVIDEYRKFLYLCCIGSQAVTPSEAVDQAWHLHLCYTRSYWIDLCKNTLQHDIHHNPTEGGGEQAELFRKQYSYTLDLYTKTFGSKPPSDIWLPVERRFTETRLLSVNPNEYQITPKATISKVLSIVTICIIFSAWLIADLYPDQSQEILVLAGVGLFVTLITKVITDKNITRHTGEGCGGCSDIHTGHDGDSGCSGDSGCGGGCGGD